MCKLSIFHFSTFISPFSIFILFYHTFTNFSLSIQAGLFHNLPCMGNSFLYITTNFIYTYFFTSVIISFRAFSRSSFVDENKISGLILSAAHSFMSVYKLGMFRPASMQFTWFCDNPAANESSICDILAFCRSSRKRESTKLSCFLYSSSIIFYNMHGISLTNNTK